MKKIFITLSLISLFSLSANAELIDVNYKANLVKGSFYCKHLGIFNHLIDAVQDQDDAEVGRIFMNGECTRVERSITVGVFQEDRSRGYASIIFPSGKKTGTTSLQALKR